MLAALALWRYFPFGVEDLAPPVALPYVQKALVPLGEGPVCSQLNAVSLTLLLLLVWVVVGKWRARVRRAPTRPQRKLPKRFRAHGPSIDCVDPRTGEVFDTVRAYSRKDVEKVFEQAREAQTEWAQSDFTERRALLQSWLDWFVLDDTLDQVVRWSTQESGKTSFEALMGEGLPTCEKLRWIVSNGEECIAPEKRGTPKLLGTKSAYVRYFPRGVIGVIVPWNYPIHNVISAVSAAVFTGNAVVVKVSEHASGSAEWVETELRRVVAQRGFDPHLVSVVTGFAETGATLCALADKVLFIGSPQVGRHVMRQCSETLTPCILELGGKDPFIVFDDCQWGHMVDIAMRGAFINCGQNCIAAERFYVQDGIYDKFCEELARRVRGLRQGSQMIGDGGPAPSHCARQEAGERKDVLYTGNDFGALTMPEHYKHVRALIDGAVEQGAEVLVGGDWDEKCGGHYLTPCVLRDVPNDSDLVQEETFGPVMTIVRFQGEKDLLEMVNDSSFGLGSSIFTTDYAKARRVSDALETGMVNVNDFGIVPMVQSLPFGGIKDSGFGCFNGKEGLRGFCRTQSLVTDKFPIRFDSPPFLQYPVAFASPWIGRHMLQFVYGKGWWKCFVSFCSMIKMMITDGKKPQPQNEETQSQAGRSKTRRRRSSSKRKRK